MVSKVKRALQHAHKVLELSSNDEDFVKVIELYVYTALIQGQLNIIKKQWDKALNTFSIAKCALDYLYVQYGQDESEEKQFSKTLINELIDNLVDPSLNLAISQADIELVSDLKTISRKYCHEEKVPVLTNVIKLIESKDPEFVSDISSSVTLIKEINWRNHQAQIYNDEIAFKIMKLTENKDWAGFIDPNQFDTVITGWTDVLELHKLDTEKNQQDDDFEQVQHRAIFLTFINYNLLFTRLKRDLLLIDKLQSNKSIEKNRDVVRLYNSIIQIVGEIKELPGVFNDEDLSYSLENLEKLFDTRKNVVLAETYQYRELFKEALSIYNHINENLTSEEQFYKVDFPFNISTNEEIAQLKQELQTKTLQSHISAQFSNSRRISSKYVVENINKFPATSELDDIINLQGKIQPILSKPVLFDIGFNYISYDLKKGDLLAINPSTSELPQQKSDQTQPEKKRGGFFGGIFGRS
ncbi:uncharacterized protein SPAPADRAFT_62397 [Spathaspora passalidarum NRRL Y-27907]|uniref:Signal recognition particle subunit SRP68 n=1 Tax=Spathaspora passalidarum (strain NRRL Y-27907 / 11-Y1) TaxID=619300 RepID=G3ARQ2_SPAPN|nr:uncharacterized protein SPAPADRAFT_62397 [Spathaspora passalidarum NRRL Y-27907]EGW31805.1 hypothetical protein SPAPADRAFT_62397 [Spathaspora passalidarum NRRL Y-27907]